MHLPTEPQIHEEKGTDLEEEINNSTIIHGDFNILLSTTDRTIYQQLIEQIKKQIKEHC